MTQEVKNFSSGVLTNGGLVQKEQEREARRQQEKLRKEAEEKSAAEAVTRRIKAREERALEKAEQEAQAKAKQLVDEERRRKADEKSAQDEVARLQVVAAKEAARLERQKDLERRLAEKAALQQQEEAKRKTQQKSAALLDSLTKEPEAEEGEPTQKQEAEEESAEPVFSPVKGEVLVPAEMPSLTSNPEPEPIAVRDISELLPPPVVLTVEAESQAPIQVESGKELIERVLSSTEKAPKDQVEETAQPNRSENRFQKMANTNRDLVKENDVLKSKVEDLLDKLHSYEIEGELVGSMMDSVDRNKKEKWHEKPGQSYLNKDHFSIVKEAKQEMLKYLSTRQGEIDHGYKSELFAKYMDDPFYMNVFVQNHGVFEWWPVIDSIYNSIGLPKPDWSKVKVTSHAPQPIRARTATLGSPVASSEQPMDRIAQHLGNMGI
ncbi:hypothetical protein [Polynucleobacter sp. JS-JIR-II-50]|uniref:hypothetical protein n=1 Tax=Polynucleobacter sp. JS-JIR-II-50 TaxID=2576919 RepID=UPI001BFD196F|nr:hypothetical protein [Polynucleobacter sp. JS-JIR-II-50]QWE05380.1 hypothetical protein FD963_04940 [Polynucleobacter sp. JS-JIR-II-50]